jgi:hypothetical protein
MIIQSEFLTEGLFGQVFNWMLDILPYLQSGGLRPTWSIRTRNYGEPPDFNIFPSIIQTTYEPDETTDEILSLESLQASHCRDLSADFEMAGRYWHSHFRFTDEVYERLEDFCAKNGFHRTVVGVHYRGTDKNFDPTQTNPISRVEFLRILEDFLEGQSDCETVFVATDDACFIDQVREFAAGRYELVFHRQPRSANDLPLFNRHEVSENRFFANSAILDCLTISRCTRVLSCSSGLSSFAKVLNPRLDAYRATCCKPDWFPMSRIPRYLGRDPDVQSLLRRLQKGDWSERTNVLPG